MNCAVCDGNRLTQLIDLPGFPLTGIFLDIPGPAQVADQGFLLCEDCGHGQLREILPPTELYGKDYWHRSSKSAIATSGNDFFVKFAEFAAKLAGGPGFNFILEIGCNDLYLLNQVKDWGDRIVGIDPIWKDNAPDDPGRIEVVGDFVEDVDYGAFNEAPDLIISSHTFEHLIYPKRELARIMQDASDDALFVFEVPGFDSLLHNYRFDQIFHQHIQYFSLASFLKMISRIGGVYVAHTFNYDYWGGTMLVAFRKKQRSGPWNGPRPPMPSTKFVRAAYSVFCSQMELLELNLYKEPVLVGYGAAQMVPTLAYHLDFDFRILDCIYDDDPTRCNLTYPGLHVQTTYPAHDLSLEGTTVLITALDSLRPIMQRIIPMKPKNILIPLNIL